MKDKEVSILIVEDEVNVLNSLNSIIGRRYEQVYLANDAQKALNIFRNEDIDLVVTDIRMPGMDGLTMLQKMKSQKPNLRRLVMSAYSESEYFLQAIDLGVDGYIVKPFSKEKLLETIKQSAKSIINERIVEISNIQIAKSEKDLRELNQTKDKFFSIIGHDVKTPVSTIASYSSILVDEFEEMEKEEILQIIKIIRNSSFRAIDLLKNLLEWAKMQTGAISFNPEIINICDIIDEEVDFASNSWAKKNISIEQLSKTDDFVYADKNMLRTVFRNLFSNAIKFTPEKGEIQLSSKILKQDGDFIQISIKDTGVGIPEKALNNLFSIKDKYSTEGTEGEKGTGMGLIFCKEFVDIQGGNIKAESTLGQGSVFSFSLPVAKKE
ncbi:MAG: hypothetical protein DRI74_03085 [Bacteroidetes bacterium]|nr:MAG: hypothetical protein DRI74_03085 [Bacteroidota bacterium]